VDAGRQEIAGRLRQQAEWCARLGSPLYDRLLRVAAADVDAGGPAWAVLAAHAGEPPGSALALRFMGAVHRVVLDGHAPALAAFYPSTGGDADRAGAEAAFLAAVAEHRHSLAALVPKGVQTNEVGRAAALLGGFLLVARASGLPLRVLEIGASGGLNLRWDHFHYRAGDARWGNAASPVVLDDAFDAATPPLDVRPRVAERAGCDAEPVDPTSPEGLRTLISYCWPDQDARIALLRAAVEVARGVPATVERADAIDWLTARLARRTPGVATVVYHSIVLQYLPRESRRRLVELLSEAGGDADGSAPLAWLHLEPGQEQSAAWLRFGPVRGAAEVRLTTWPGGEERLIATASAHGRPVHWLL
jgi:hypothetical protein